MAEDKTEQVRESLKTWIGLDDQERQLRTQIKTLREQKTKISSEILGFMKDNEVDNFALEGNGFNNSKTTDGRKKKNYQRPGIWIYYHQPPAHFFYYRASLLSAIKKNSANGDGFDGLSWSSS